MQMFMLPHRISRWIGLHQSIVGSFSDGTQYTYGTFVAPASICSDSWRLNSPMSTMSSSRSSDSWSIDAELSHPFGVV